ncbi:hypothetical protein EV421DRAFT_1746086 [Armillaria borealis]|uniref:Uncharacterized protein n=1 Tax=Armillaria borealis TaxID=47425 RepID=A0AA39IDR6_9AGAR|nr:hypothetical protein EV421DRAFT_1746086 [Armillaria borealis]
MGKKQCLKKEQRKNLEGWADGGRERILSKHVLPYSDCLERGWHAEESCLDTVYREYTFHVHWHLKDHKEPTQPFCLYDPHAPREVEELMPKEAQEKRKRLEEIYLKKHLKFRKNLLNDPWNLYLTQLASITRPPKARQAYQEWFTDDTNKKLVAAVVQERWEKELADGSASGGPNVNLRMAVAHELFQALPPEEWEEWKAKARDIADHNRAEYFNLCINNLPAFAALLLQGMSKRTGLSVFMIVGGPMLKNKGVLGTLNLSWGKNLEPKPVAWPKWDKKKFKEQVQDFFLDFLHTAYTPDNCANTQLPESGGTHSTLNDNSLYSFDNELKLKGINEDLDEVSDSSSEDDDTSDGERQPDPMASPPHKRQCVSGKARKVKGKKGTTGDEEDSSNKENAAIRDDGPDGHATSSTSKGPRLSKYERQREANIAAIANHPLMREINEDLECMRMEKSKPKPKPRPKKSAAVSSGDTLGIRLPIDFANFNQIAQSTSGTKGYSGGFTLLAKYYIRY